MKCISSKRSVVAAIAVHLPLALLVWLTLFAEKQRSALRDPCAMLMALTVIEALFIIFFIRSIRRGGSGFGALSITCFIWLLFLTWEICTSVKAVAHPVLIPSPENVFDTFRTRWQDMLLNIWYSMRLLLAGFMAGLSAAVICGAFVGWIPWLKAFAYPIARNRAMIFRIIFPCIFPGVISGLKVSLTASLLMLNFAELMGASHGMGYFIQNSIAYANYTNAVAGIIVVGIVVTTLTHLASFIQKHAVKWR